VGEATGSLAAGAVTRVSRRVYVLRVIIRDDCAQLAAHADCCLRAIQLAATILGANNGPGEERQTNKRHRKKIRRKVEGPSPSCRVTCVSSLVSLRPLYPSFFAPPCFHALRYVVVVVIVIVVSAGRRTRSSPFYCQNNYFLPMFYR